MNLTTLLPSEAFKKRLLSQLSKEFIYKLEDVDVSYNLKHEEYSYDEYGNLSMNVCSKVIVQVKSTHTHYLHSWVFDNPVTSKELRFCLRWMRKNLRQNLKQKR